jgi:hypothetical protein
MANAFVHSLTHPLSLYYLFIYYILKKNEDVKGRRWWEDGWSIVAKLGLTLVVEIYCFLCALTTLNGLLFIGKATWQLGNLATWQLGNLMKQLGNKREHRQSPGFVLANRRLVYNIYFCSSRRTYRVGQDYFWNISSNSS